MVVITMTRRKNQSDFGTSKLINKATTELTKTAIIVTVVFIISLGFDLWYYVLGYSGVIDYVLNSPLQVSKSSHGTVVSSLSPSIPCTF